MKALYSFRRYLSSFNFGEWLLQAEANGATEIVFDTSEPKTGKWPLNVVMQRIESICLPMPALIGLPYSIGTDGADLAQPGGAQLVAFWKKGRRFRRLRSVKAPGVDKYTVTLRNTQRSPLRNSDERVWRDFATEIGARVIPDYDVEPIHLHDRMALYAGAEMNFFVSNGPGLLCSWTEYPCMLFNTHHAKESLKGDGIDEGEQYPWMLPNQRAVWEQATAENLREHFEHWRETGTFLC